MSSLRYCNGDATEDKPVDPTRSPGDLPFGLYWLQNYGYVIALRCMNCRRQVVNTLDIYEYQLHRFGIKSSGAICEGCLN